MFTFTIAELAAANKPAMKFWRNEFVKVLAAAGVDEKFCTKLMCQYSQYMEIPELLADVLSQYIQTRAPKRLEFYIPDHVDYPAQLCLFLREIRLHHEGEFRVYLQHSYLNYVPCDSVIEVLAGGR